jgi:hypothetical protein
MLQLLVMQWAKQAQASMAFTAHPLERLSEQGNV